jgi:hypothetical protein
MPRQKRATRASRLGKKQKSADGERGNKVLLVLMGRGKDSSSARLHNVVIRVSTSSDKVVRRGFLSKIFLTTI